MTSGAPSSSPRSHRGRRAGLTALLVGSLVAGGAVVATTVAGPAGAVTTDPTQYTNIVTLQTGTTTNAVMSYGTVAGYPEETQLLTSKSSNCTLIPTGDPIIGFGTPGTRGKVVGLRAGSIGVVDKTSGESCAQVTGNETLDLSLPGPMSLAVLDLEVQKNAVIDATLTYGSGTNAVTVTQQLRSGEAAIGQPADSEFFSCLPGSVSSAPNSNDNCRWVIEGALFDRISLKATQGQFSLEGGSDAGVPVNPIQGNNAQEPTGAEWPTNLTYFKPASGINCGDTITFDGSLLAPDVSITRVTPTGVSCTVIPYSLSGGSGRFTFNKPVGAADAQFYINVTWKALPGGDVKKTTINYLQGGIDIELAYCPQVVYTAAGGPLSATQIATLTDQENATTAKEYACIVGGAGIAGPGTDGYLTINQRIYLLGDPIMRG